MHEASSQSTADINEKRELEKKSKEMNWAAGTMKKLRKKSRGFTDGKSGVEIIRELREKK